MYHVKLQSQFLVQHALQGQAPGRIQSLRAFRRANPKGPEYQLTPRPQDSLGRGRCSAGARGGSLLGQGRGTQASSDPKGLEDVVLCCVVCCVLCVVCCVLCVVGGLIEELEEEILTEY